MSRNISGLAVVKRGIGGAAPPFEMYMALFFLQTWLNVDENDTANKVDAIAHFASLC